MTQQEIADITGIKPSNMARFESGGRVPTLSVLEKWREKDRKKIKGLVSGSNLPYHAQRSEKKTNI